MDDVGTRTNMEVPEKIVQGKTMPIRNNLGDLGGKSIALSGGS